MRVWETPSFGGGMFQILVFVLGPRSYGTTIHLFVPGTGFRVQGLGY